MRLTVLAVGQREDPWVNTAVKDYLARFPKGFTVELRELKTEPRAGQTPQKLMQAEARRIEKSLDSDDVLVVLDERGRDLTTVEFADRIARWKDDARNVTFVIGGPDGLDAAFKTKADFSMRLSSMTLPHAIARVLLCEQLYRAWSILNNHPYHRA